MKRLTIAIVGLGLFAAACATEGAVAVKRLEPGNPAPTRSPKASPQPTFTSPTPSQSSNSPARTLTVQVWFTSGEHLFLTTRTQEFTLAVGRAALTQLLAGPTADERAAGVGTQVPAGTQLLGLSITDGVANVDLSGGFDDGGGSASERMRLAQVVYTITQFPTVQGVNFELDGDPVTTFSGEGIVLDHPQTRTDFDDVLPAIVVDAPRVGQRVASPVTISGTADVFEATVSIWILDEDGNTIAQAFTTATCGSGCRGDYSTQVEYHVDHEQPGIIQVFESSAKDGSPVNVVKIPVTLTA